MQKRANPTGRGHASDEVDVDALIERLYLLRRLEEAEEELAAGQVLEHEEVERRMAQWLK